MKQIEREITTKEKEKIIFLQQLNNLKTTLDNYSNIFNIFEQIKSKSERINKIKFEIQEKREKIMAIEKQYPSIKKNDLMPSQRLMDDKQIKETLDNNIAEYMKLDKQNELIQKELNDLENKKIQIEQKQRMKEEENRKLASKREEFNILKKKKIETDAEIPKIKNELELIGFRLQELESELVFDYTTNRNL